MAKKKRRGRPLTFKGKLRFKLAKLVEKHGATGAKELSPVPISEHTLLKIAHEYAIPLKKGKRPKTAA